MFPYLRNYSITDQSEFLKHADAFEFMPELEQDDKCNPAPKGDPCCKQQKPDGPCCSLRPLLKSGRKCPKEACPYGWGSCPLEHHEALQRLLCQYESLQQVCSSLLF